MQTDSLFAKVIHATLHAPRHPIRKVIWVRATYKREKGRFAGIKRRGYFRHIRDKTRTVTGMELLAENISQNNALLARLRERGDA